MESIRAAIDEQYQRPALLLVDDEQNILSSLRRLLRPLGYEIYTATSGAEGLSVLERERIDLIISDMRMPEMDGAVFLEQAAARWPDTIRILLTGYAEVGSTIAAINKGEIYKYISKPWDENDIILSVKHALEKKFLEQERRRLEALTKVQNEQLREFNSNLEAKVAARTDELRKSNAALAAAHESLKKSYIATVKTFANLIEMRAGVASGHSRRVAEIVRELATNLNMSASDTQDLIFAALLHDIGNIGLTDRIINKPFHALEQNERQEVIRHPLVGEAMLMSLEPLQGAALIIRSHHERFNGNGYPEGLKGEEIPLGARVLAVASDYDALQHGMIWSRRMSAQEAKDYLEENSGKLYDPKVVEALVHDRIKSKPKQETIVALSSNDIKPGMVLARDILTKDGASILVKGHELDERTISRIHGIENALEHEFTIYINQSNLS